ncbi:DUF5331 domain-containing protein [Rivularia sp. UHCC 0363]|uniref:DUF5331 domain-containing protein n=1 Tax=Rivularia sp. UHCC 0363 TaxID=3110244 RepID=UPI002B21AB27|nr:DUF5331 domain-containing protein [Rivularia sp. UHCC 0363]MEA5599013.1 DUF5331 domain-containing protein [Rivularia sp. UHCC 0363]
MNIQQLRESLKIKWVKYYHQNRPWLAKMRIWGTYDGFRRPSSGFILATLSLLEPKLDDIFPFILELNNNPDEIIAALGLNFNPDEQLHLIKNIDEPLNHRDDINQEKITDRDIYESSPSTSTAITKIESFSSPQKIIPRTESVEREFQVFAELIRENSHQPVLEASAIAQLETESEILSLLNMCEETEAGKIVEVSSEETEETKSTSRKKVSKLASWIDEFCQGTGWDREEAIFIPF